jgi:protein TonB
LGVDLSRLALIGVGVISSHALALWLVNLSTVPDAIVLQQPMMVLLTPASPTPKPLNASPTKAIQATTAPTIRSAAAQPPPPSKITNPPIRHAEQATLNSPPQATEPALTRPAGDPMPTAASGNTTVQKSEFGTATGLPPAKPLAPVLQLPSSNADYLNNPAPVYPAISQRLGEQGQVVVRVLIGKDGQAHQGDVHQSSGYDRLDQAALRAVLSWRFVPGQRAGVPQDMWFNVPVSFNLK